MLARETVGINKKTKNGIETKIDFHNESRTAFVILVLFLKSIIEVVVETENQPKD